MLLLLFVAYYLGDDGQAAFFPSYIGTVSFLALCAVSSDVRAMLGAWRAVIFLAFVTYLAASGLWSQPASLMPLGHAVLLVGFVFGITITHRNLPRILTYTLDLLILAAAMSAAISVYLFHSIDVNPLDEKDRLYAFGRIYNPVISAVSYAIPLLFAVTRVIFEKSLVRRCLLVAASICLIYAIILTGTRSVWLGLLGAPVAIILINPNLTTRRRLTALAIVAAGAATLVAVAFAAGFGDNIVRRALSFRPEIWSAMLDRIQSGNWLLGHGIYTDSSVTWQHLTFDHAHSVYLATLFYGGVVGLTLFVTMIGSTLVDLRNSRFDERSAMAIGGFAFALVTLAIDGDRLVEKVDHLWIVFWLPLALVWTAAPRGHRLD